MSAGFANLSLALTAGTLAAFNPCGFALLPAYLAMLAEQGVGRALRVSAVMTAGFVTVFGLFGLVVAPLAVSVGRYLPWATIVIGLALAGLGVWLLTGHELLLPTPRLRIAWKRPSFYVYGLSYAVASLSCTIGPFLAVTTASLTENGPLAALAVFVAYALGMGLVVAALSVAVALASSAAVARMRGFQRHVPRISGVLLVLAGLYVAYYGWYELRLFQGAAAGDPIVGAAAAVQSWISRVVGSVGAGWIAAALVALVTLAALIARSSRPHASRARGERFD